MNIVFFFVGLAVTSHLYARPWWAWLRPFAFVLLVGYAAAMATLAAERVLQ